MSYNLIDNNNKDIINEYNNIINNKILALAPMVNNSSKSYRLLARQFGANLVFTEMINCESYLRGQNIKLMDDSFFNSFLNNKIKNSSFDLSIQICGNNINIIWKCINKIINQLNTKIFSFDLNLGCPQKIAKKGNYGAFLAENTNKTYLIVRELCEKLNKIGINLTCKIRIKSNIKETIEYVKKLEECGISMLTVHGRTIEQKGTNSGRADWYSIKCIKEVLKIPVIGNGNIACKRDIIDLFNYTKVDGVMVAESHLYDPLIFYSKSNEKSIYDVIRLYLDFSLLNNEHFGELKSHFYKIFHKFILKNKIFFNELNKVINIKGYDKLIEKYKEELINEKCEVKLRSNYLRFIIYLFLYYYLYFYNINSVFSFII